MHSKNVCNVHENGKNEHEEVDMYKYPPFLYIPPFFLDKILKKRRGIYIKNILYAI